MSGRSIRWSATTSREAPPSSASKRCHRCSLGQSSGSARAAPRRATRPHHPDRAGRRSRRCDLEPRRRVAFRMRRRPLWLIGCAISVTLGGSAQEPHRNGRDAAVETSSAPPRLGDIVQLLQANQGIVLGAPAGSAESTASLLYLQRFQSSEAMVNSVERHADGTAYASYTTPLGPDWYDVARADDAEDTRERVIPAGRAMRRFSDVRAANVNDARWLPPDRAFRPGRGPAPRWVTIHLPLTPRATIPLARSGDYCSRDIVS